MELWVPESRLDRVGDRRVERAWLVRAFESDAARLLVVDPEGLIDVDADGLPLFAPTQGAFEPTRHLLVGTVDDAPVFAVAGPHAAQTAPVRGLLTRLDDTTRDTVTSALALVNWHAYAPRCGLCGSKTTIRLAGHARYCETCERERFPRTDPAIITAIVDADDRLLLAHNTAWPTERMSLIAGFVDAGESLEQAVRREAAEEVGLTLTALEYAGSQPWPFPRSLMLGFVARCADADALTPDAAEIDRAQFFTRDAFDAALADGSLGAPTPGSIASRLIRGWRDGTLRLP